MEYNRMRNHRDRLTGYEEQEILISMLTRAIADIVKMSPESLTIYVRQALDDALEKRHLRFKDVKKATQDVKTAFVKDLVINTVKRAKLIESVDKIITECNRVYDEWKHTYRPEEIE